MTEPRKIPDFGPNHTGVATHEDRTEEMVEGTLVFRPSSTGTTVADDAVRIDYARQSDELGLGSVPPPTEAAADDRTALMLDKLGERLAFERTGVRLYEALVSKHEAFGGHPGGPTRDELLEILNDEHRHFSMLVEVVEGVGGDPTAVTPAADVVGTVAMGVVKVITDHRTTLLQSLEAILVAELADRDGWSLLVELARELGDDDMVAQFVHAEQAEIRHVARVRAWIRAGYEPGTKRAAQ